jgi:uncharacterized protein YyaL (SSP411 family)
MKRREWTDAAVKAFDFIVEKLGDGDTLYHSWRAGKRGSSGFADDYAHMARAALALWESTGKTRFLEKAKHWVQAMNENFWDEFGGGYFFTGKRQEALFVRARSVFDQSQPPANAVMLGVLSRLHMATAEDVYAQRAASLIRAFAQEVTRAFPASGSFLNNLEFAATNLQIVVKGAADHAKTHELVAAVLGRSLPNKFLIVVPPDHALPEQHIAHDKAMVDGGPTAWLCQRGAISTPISNPVALSQILQLPQQRPAQVRPQ